MPEASPITRIVEYVDGHSQMVINPYGARIEELELDGNKLLTSIVRGDGRKASTHPCTPIFGSETTTSFGLPQHGPMRNELCAVVEESPNDVIISHEVIAGTYPEGMVVTQRFFVSPRLFSLLTLHCNMGEQPLPVNFGEHFYWHTPKGWEGLKINEVDVTDVVKNDEAIPLKERNQILIPGLPTITLGQEGLPWANLWAYQNPGTGQYDQNYVCIEPVERNPKDNPFGTEESLIHPMGRVRVTRITISI